MDYSGDWRNTVGTLASVGTVLQMLSPLPTCSHFLKSKSVGDMIVTPYIVAFMSCSLWLYYGILVKDRAVISVNLIGALLQFVYVVCYYKYCSKREDVRRQALGGLCVLSVVIIYPLFEVNFDAFVSFLGLYCSCVTVAFFASPLANMHHVLEVWDSESLPRLLILATFVVSSQWSLYGYIVDDRYILVTNLLGTLLSSIQVFMMLIIPRGSNSKPLDAI